MHLYLLKRVFLQVWPTLAGHFYCYSFFFLKKSWQIDFSCAFEAAHLRLSVYVFVTVTVFWCSILLIVKGAFQRITRQKVLFFFFVCVSAFKKDCLFGSWVSSFFRLIFGRVALDRLKVPSKWVKKVERNGLHEFDLILFFLL